MQRFSLPPLSLPRLHALFLFPLSLSVCVINARFCISCVRAWLRMTAWKGVCAPSERERECAASRVRERRVCYFPTTVTSSVALRISQRKLWKLPKFWGKIRKNKLNVVKVLLPTWFQTIFEVIFRATGSSYSCEESPETNIDKKGKSEAEWHPAAAAVWTGETEGYVMFYWMTTQPTTSLSSEDRKKAKKDHITDGT